MKYMLEVEIDLDGLCESVNIKEHIETEMGWVSDSGFRLVDYWEKKGCQLCENPADHEKKWDEFLASGELVVPVCDSCQEKLQKQAILELAFGDDASEKGFTNDDLFARLMEFSNKAFAWDELAESVNLYPENDTQYAYDLREKMETYLGSVQ
jgi:hypothetical protein